MPFSDTRGLEQFRTYARVVRRYALPSCCRSHKLSKQVHSHRLAMPLRPIVEKVQERDDRRDGGRTPIELKVEYKRLNSFFADYTKNISRGGTFIRTEKPLEIGTDFLFKLGIPTLTEPLVLTGKVQWVITPEQAGPNQEPGMGIGFIFESEAHRQRVLGVVERLMLDQLGPVLYDKLMTHRPR